MRIVTIWAFTIPRKGDTDRGGVKPSIRFPMRNLHSGRVDSYKPAQNNQATENHPPRMQPTLPEFKIHLEKWPPGLTPPRSVGFKLRSYFLSMKYEFWEGGSDKPAQNAINYI